MWFIAVCWIWISVASLNYEDLVADVENTLDDCLSIMWDVRMYVNDIDSILGDVSGGDEEDGSHATTVDLASCISLQKVVNNYRDAHSRLVLVQDFLHWQEKAYLNQLLAPESKEIGFSPLYIASEDGDLADNFHDKCDGKGPTVVIIETTDGNVFGGYTDISWARNSDENTSTRSFLFQLRPIVSQYSIKIPQAAVYHNSETGPVFGNGHDLVIVDRALNNSQSNTNGNAYNLEGNQLNGGEPFFQVSDYVVFEAIALKN